MVDLLVSMAVMALLVSMLLPSLGRAREAGYRTASASNIRQQAIGMQVYAYDRNGQMPTSIFRSKDNDGIDAPEQMVFLRVNVNDALVGTQRGAPKANAEFSWDGLGRLFQLEYLSKGEVFYNPSHDSIHTYDRYADQFNGAEGEIVGNYHYRWDAQMRSIDRIRPQTTLIADSMRSQPEYNHVNGNNMLKGDLSVSWFADKDGLLYRSLATESPKVVDAAMSVLSSASREGVLIGWDLLDKSNKDGTSVSATQVNDPLGAFFALDFK